MYIIEGYPEFVNDIKIIWDKFITKYRFKIINSSFDSVIMSNTKCIIELHLGVEERVFYFFRNQLTDNKFDYVPLQIYKGIPFDRNLVGGNNYPISNKEWIKLYAENNFRSICQIDLPIVRDEITANFKTLLEGDFRFENEYFEWIKWYEQQKKKGIDYKQLSVYSYRNAKR